MGRDTVEVLRQIEPSTATEKLSRAYAAMSDSGRNVECHVSKLGLEIYTFPTAKEAPCTRLCLDVDPRTCPFADAAARAPDR